MPDMEGQRWLYRFITHEYSVLLEYPASCRAIHNRARHDLDIYIWSLEESVRSRCAHIETFKKLSLNRYAMKLTLLDGCELLL